MSKKKTKLRECPIDGETCKNCTKLEFDTCQRLHDKYLSTEPYKPKFNSKGEKLYD